MLYHLLFPLHDLFGGFNVFRYITFRAIGATLTAFFVVIFCGTQFIALMRNRQIGQVVRADGPASHFSKQGVPTMGGLLIILAVTLTTLLWVDLRNHLVWLALGITLWYGAIGAYDDYCKIKRQSSAGLSARGKILLQIGGAALLGWLLSAHQAFDGHVSLPLFKHISPNLGDWYVLFAILVIVGASNAVNLTDGLDGLATGPTVITAGVYLLFSYLAGHVVLASYLQIPYVEGAGELAVFCGSLVGASLGFLWFNAFPAQVFMGDVGSLALGGALGTVAVMIKQEFLLALVGGIFVMEALSVILQVEFLNISGGKRILMLPPLKQNY